MNKGREMMEKAARGDVVDEALDGNEDGGRASMEDVVVELV